MPLPLPAVSAAREIGKAADWSLSNLALQKVLYLAHMFYLGRTGSRLVSEDFEAWDYGPVVPALYHRAKIFGSGPVRDVFFAAPQVRDADQLAFLREAAHSLGKISPGRLVSMTHRRDGAWARTYRAGQHGLIISEDKILDEYRSLQARAA